MAESVVHPAQQIQKFAVNRTITDLKSKELAEALDEQDDLREYRDVFHYPKMRTLPRVDKEIVNPDDDCVYLCGNSLGLCPKAAKSYFMEEIDKWQDMGVEGHKHGKYPWAHVEDYITDQMAKVVGGEPIEVCVMGGLSSNVNTLLITFYRPTPQRHKILIESGAFPSDHISVEAQIRMHGYDPETSLILAKPRPGEEILRTEDIVEIIKKEGDEIAVVMFSGVQYYTGQFFDMKTITEIGHKKGCKVGFDLAHAVCNVELRLHDWDVDFACWCTYKYCNAGPGATAGIFVHKKYANEGFNLKRLAGWWGIDMKKRFDMDNTDLSLVPGAAGFAVSNPPLFSTMGLFASLELIDKIGMERLIKKQKLLTGYLEMLINLHFNASGDKNDHVTILTPQNIKERGCQLSLAFQFPIEKVFKNLTKRGVVCDLRKPKVIRIAPAPMYNSFKDVYRFIEVLKEVIERINCS